MRYAVYTRVSVDRDPNDRFGSTNAQFMACHEFIASQLSKRWRPVDRLYEDRGFSGSNMRRPGLQSLLSDICSGLFDIVVVHRLDRLTRHLGDLQTLMTQFEQRGVSLVLVTRSMNTSDHYGRLALNLLTSFAEFERALIGERTREASSHSSTRPMARHCLTFGLYQIRVTVDGLIDLIFELLDEKDLDVIRARIIEAQKTNEA